MMMATQKTSKTSLPDLPWRKATCEVCGSTFDYLKRRAPHTCNDGECRYKYQHGIDRTTWANYQPTLFDTVE